ncbi:hypothetical protein B0F90DRAFT_1824041 [Multifurca ochricompacta]|uniref:FAD/NAD(P)-binding domain-containing protein n=1 Tax=Multifurca ochricompacta TaxID=376703 RepID=A0AAD4LVJ1_9AGAM|nr:hypothetical protein B0F90DRAFT_1824041 [Multifurca ochricompacta]
MLPNFLRLAFSFLPFQFTLLPLPLPPQVPLDLGLGGTRSPLDVPNKRIVIIGGGTAGIVTLKTLIADLPKNVTSNWEIVLLEQRDNIGGIWYPDPNLPTLLTFQKHHLTIPQFPFLVGTALFPNHTFVFKYHESIISHWNLSSYIHLEHEVLSADWHGNNVSGHWQLTTHDHARNRSTRARFDHLIVATGHNHYPYEPKLQGRPTWEASAPGRKVLHSMFYRDPEAYSGRNVLVVGGGASGRDIAQQVVGFANSVRTLPFLLLDSPKIIHRPSSLQTYVSIKDQPFRPISFPHIPGVERVPALLRFTPFAPVFKDGTSLPHIDTVIFATGYELRIPFLSSSVRDTPIITPLPDPEVCDTLTNNGRYLRPLFRHIFSLAPTHAPRALAFVGLPIYVANAISDSAQALLIAHALADDKLLPPHSALLADLRAQEAAVDDPARVGHRILQPGGGTGYQNEVVRLLQDRGLGGRPNVPPLGTAFTEPWRVFAVQEGTRLRRAWLKVESLGEGEVNKWLSSVKKGDEAEWDDFMVRLVEWDKEQGGGGGEDVDVVEEGWYAF